MRARIEAALNLFCWPILTTFYGLFGRRPTENDEADVVG